MTRSERDPFRDPFPFPSYRGGNGGNGSGRSQNDGNDGNGSQRPSMDSDWKDRLRAAVEATIRQRQHRAAIRQEFASRRAVGLQRRHAAKLERARHE